MDESNLLLRKGGSKNQMKEQMWVTHEDGGKKAKKED